mmetsp:Transcript_67443/g.161798  ORF Transcript_67443/g.161798 Transcript_67443/m.161798 type:complete len:172 (-) Transcript_67443:205-720(-)
MEVRCVAFLLMHFAILVAKADASQESDRLLKRLIAAGDELAQASIDRKAVQCSCENFCGGQCFAYGCAPCAASTWSFPGGADLCKDPGPLGRGLLCHVVGGQVTDQACCSVGGDACALPEGECCSSGDCESCDFKSNTTALFPPLPNRFFDNATNVCQERLVPAVAPSLMV